MRERQMKRLFLSLAAIAMLAAPAAALTLEQAQHELAGMHCYGSGCSSSETVSTTVQNPDIVTTTEVQLTPGADGANHSGEAQAGCWVTTMDHKMVRATNVNSDCVPYSIFPTTSVPEYGLVETITPGGTSVVQSCQTTVKTLTYNGPFTSRDSAWSVDSSTSSNDGAC